MRFAVRDDDTGFFTLADELPQAYGCLWEQIPLSLAMIPYEVQSHHRGDPGRFRQDSTPVSLADNAALVKLLRPSVFRGRICVMLHGFQHRYQATRPGPYDARTWLPECLFLERMREKLLAGRQLLERLFAAPVSVFVPPSNAITGAGLRALSAAGLDLGCALGIRRLLRANPLNAWLEVSNRAHPAYPYCVRRYVGHREVRCQALTPSCGWRPLLASFEECARRDGAFVVATHYWELARPHSSERAPLRELLLQLVERARRRAAEFVTVPALLEKS